jgi:hypothetical protein
MCHMEIEYHVSQRFVYRLQLSQALLTHVLSLSLLRRFVDVPPISELRFGEAVSTDSPSLSEAEK